jgi:cell wall-associated NlpC family hydrolase
MAASDARRALALVGTPFLPQGRDQLRGLDCVGLCLEVYRLPKEIVRNDYRLRGGHLPEIIAALAAEFRRLVRGCSRPGDLVLMQPADRQYHLGILTERGMVHADARLRRVVEIPGAPHWPVLGIYRRKKGRG